MLTYLISAKHTKYAPMFELGRVDQKRGGGGGMGLALVPFESWGSNTMYLVKESN